MLELRCTGCNKKLLSYDKISFRRYKSPVKKCKKCGKIYADPRCHEIAVEGLPSDTFSVKSYIGLIILGAFLIYRGVHMSSMHQLGVNQEMQWFMPTFLALVGIICVIGGICEIVIILSGVKAKKFDRLRKESEQRLQDKSYVHILSGLGYDIPEKYR